MPRYFVKLSLTERFPGGGEISHNLNADYDAERPIEAINAAIARAFTEAEQEGNTLTSIFVGQPREA